MAPGVRTTMLKKILKYLALILFAVVIVGVFLPAKSTASRQIEIKAPATVIFGLLNGFQRFNEFSPWYQYDPGAEYSWSGPTTGVGATMAWKSAHERVGNGMQEIIAVEANQSVTTRLQFDAPGTSIARWQLTPAPGSTRVTWQMESDAGWNLLGRWFGVFLDRMIGPDFESGLKRLKSVAEAEASKPAVAAQDIALLKKVDSLVSYVFRPDR